MSLLSRLTNWLNYNYMNMYRRYMDDNDTISSASDRSRSRYRYMLPTSSWMNRTSRSYGDSSRSGSRRSRRSSTGSIASRRRHRSSDRFSRYSRYPKRRITRSVATDKEDKPEITLPRASEEELLEGLTVKYVDLRISTNSFNHHTNDYEVTKTRQKNGKTLDPELVVRRGDEFDMILTLSRTYDKEADDMRLIFTTGDRPLPKSGTHANFELSEDKDTSYKPNDWGATIKEISGDKMTLSVYIPCNCVIGKWKFNIKTILKQKDEKETELIYKHKDNSLIILLNPWCKDDKVYMEGKTEKDEYVLNDGGAVFYGNYRQIGARPWNFAQFADPILDISLYLLQRAFGNKIDGNMSDPSNISRALSKIINNNDDDGVLVGNWSGNYKDGTKPTVWSGSYKILTQYMTDDPDNDPPVPVKYGQCWVFSGVLTTVCRALGLPCRSVTNFASAHDTDKSCTIDKTFYFDSISGELCEGDNGDSSWNFHVWNEVWMRRPDLGSKYDGWQVIDATPQELSDGVFCLGPSPVSAVKNGEIHIGKDTDFVFAEVNADCIDWFRHGFDEYFVMSINKDKVGRNISTKKATGFGLSGSISSRNSKDREDLTSTYKYSEGSTKERRAVAAAMERAKHKRVDEMPTKSDIKMECEELDGILFGNEFTYNVIIKNTGSESKTLSGSVAVTAQFYDGHSTEKLKTQPFTNEVVKGHSEKKVSIHLTPDDYLGKLPDHYAMKILAFGIIKEDNRACVVYDDFRLRRPDIHVEGPLTCKEGETVELKLYLENPLPVPLTGCSLEIEGSLVLSEEVHGQEDIIKLADIKGKQKWEKSLFVIPKKREFYRKERDFFVTFDSDILMDVVGYHHLEVES